MKPRSGIALVALAVIGIAVLLAVLFSPKPPTAASNPTPPDEARNVSPGGGLTWTPGERAVTHQLCLGKIDQPPVVAETSGKAEYNPGMLTPAATYFWQVNEIGKSGAVTPGPVWRFTTAEAKPVPPPAPPPIKKNVEKPAAPAVKPAAVETSTAIVAVSDPEPWEEQPEAEFGSEDALMSAGQVKVYLGDYTVKKGDVFDVAVSLTAPPLESFILVLCYDPARLEIVPEGGRPVNQAFRQRPVFTFSQEKGIVVVTNGGAPGSKNLNATDGTKSIVKLKMRAKLSGETTLRPGTGNCFTNGTGKDERYSITGGRVMVR